MADPSDLDSGPRAAKPGTARMCVVSRRVCPIDDLIRFVMAPTGEVVADFKRRLPGRGLWVTASRAVVADAARRHHFSKGFKRDVRVAATFAEDVEARLVKFVLDSLAMAAKAGQAVSGFTRVEAVLSSNEAVALIHASDAAPDGVRKLDAIVRQSHGNSAETSDFPTCTALSSAELDLALGRSNVIHAALLAGPASRTFLSRSQFLVRYRMAGGDGADNAVTRSTTTRTVRTRTTPGH